MSVIRAAAERCRPRAPIPIPPVTPREPVQPQPVQPHSSGGGPRESDKPDTSAMHAPSPAAQASAELEKVIAELRQGIAELRKDIDTNKSQLAENVWKRSSLALPADAVKGSATPSRKGIDIPWGLLAAGAASATGVGIPVWAVMAYRGARAVRRIRKTQTAHSPPPLPPDVENTIVVDTPRAPEKHWINSEFINVESDHYQRAHERARQDIARRYPGSQEILEAELSLTRQWAAAMPSA
ncbi:hypothetical protein LCGC14_0643480 [marine sediment metagenome]|uniref:Uncharacterized protein n=1 Tax=marine sediment metagenome TaxID=412755 RepID=A0A0F9RI12_9ZZZZ